MIGALSATLVVVAPELASSKARAATPAEAAPSAAAAASAAARAASDRRLAEKIDDQLLNKYPDKATWGRLMSKELSIVNGHLDEAIARLNELRVKRKKLDEKAEFYKGRPLPPDLQLEMDKSEAGFRASALVFGSIEQDIAYIVDKFNRPLPRLEKLWAGAPLGSMGVYVEDAAASPAKQVARP